MAREWWWRSALVIALLVLSIFGLVPTVVGWFHTQQVNEKIAQAGSFCTEKGLDCGTILYTEADGKLRVPFSASDKMEEARESLTQELSLGEPTIPTGQTTLAFSLPDILPSWYKSLYAKKISLGLDLQGGIHLVLGVEVEKALVDIVDRMTEEVDRYCEDEKLGCKEIRVIEGKPAMTISFPDKETLDSAKEKISKFFGDMVEIPNPTDKDFTIAFEMSEDLQTYRKNHAVEQVLKTLRNRIDEMAVREALVAKQGDRSILVQIPGVKDPERAMELIGRTAHLVFKIVDDTNTELFQHKNEVPEGWELKSESARNAKGGLTTVPYLTAVKDPENKNIRVIREWVKGKVGPDKEVLFEEEVIKKANIGQDVRWRSYVVDRKTAMTGETIVDARVNIDQRQNRPYVSMTFDRQGAKQFEQVTGDHIHERMAIVLDNKVQSAPVIQSRIGGGRAQITLNALRPYRELMEEAQDLAIVLRAGALQAPVKIEEIRTVGPTLGKDSIESGKISIIAGFVLVVFFMLIYYRVAGIFADVALVCNMIFLMAVLAFFEATLTLPGMAGIVLTLGMAVDANVIINERVREEQRINKTPRASVESGYDRAFWTIFDANVTTALAGFILWTYGTGPVKGFAVTLLVGIISSMFSAIVITRLFIDYVIVKFKPAKLSI